MQVLQIFFVAGLLWGSVTGGFLPSSISFGNRLADNLLRKPMEKMDKLREIWALSPFPKPSRGVQADVCYTDECLDASLALLRSINFTVNPCDDFYDFSCGRWMAENPIPPTASSWAQFDVMRRQLMNTVQDILVSPDDPSDFKPMKQAKELYSVCTNTDAIEAEGVAHLLAILALAGGWPAITQNWNPAGFDLFSVIAQARREIMLPIIVTPYVHLDYNNSTRRVVYLDQPNFFLHRLILLNPEASKPRIDAYINYFVSVAKELAKITQTPVVESELIAQAKDVIAFETRLAEISAPDEIRYDLERTYNPYKLDAYQEEIGRIEVVNPHAKVNYKSLVDLITLTSGVTINPDEDVIVKEKDYLAKYIQVLDTTDIRTIANYVHWRLVEGLAPDTLQVFRDIKFEFDKSNLELVEPTSREDFCANIATTIFGMAISVKYIERTFDEEAKVNVNQMVENVRTVFKDLLDENDWMDEETKTHAHEKISVMRKLMAYPDWIFNQTRLEKEFEDLEVVPGYYMRTTLSILMWLGNQELKRLRPTVDKDSWIVSPAVVNAFYDHQSNAMHFPAGILQPPFYRLRAPQYINYGAIGGVIGHEITHGFDKRGSQFNSEGNAVNWWSDEVLLRFQEKTKCFVDQYSAFETPVGNVNGNLTVTENVADNGGIRQTYFAYRNWVANSNGGQEEPRLPGLEQFTPDQLLFLGWGNVYCRNINDKALAIELLGEIHSPSNFRLIGSLQNFQTFADKWSCPAGSLMNPDHRCVLW